MEIILLDIQSPNWAEILQGLGAIIGIPGAIAAFVLLFMKDNEKQEQINGLKKISEKIEGQNEILIQSNSLAEEQIEVLRKMLLTPEGEGYDKLAEIELQKLKLSVKPNLKSNGQSYRMSELWVDINNYGETAFIDNIIIEDNKFYPLNNIPNGFELEKGNQIRIGLKTKDESKTYAMQYAIQVFYHDALDNNFRMDITRDNVNAALKIKHSEI